MMVDIGSFLDRRLEIAASLDLPIGPDEIVLFPAGNVELFGEDPIVMDAEAASVVIERFNDRGVDIPIDYEHSTLYKAGKGEPSPAAGWIKSLRFDPSIGLIGTVEWGAEAQQQIKAKQYRYLSPHFRIETETRRVDHVLAVALTNTPRINNMRELVAASVAAAQHLTGDTAQEDTEMAKKLITRLASVLNLEGDPTEDAVVAAVEQAVAQDGAPAEPTPEEQAAMVAKDSLMALQRALMEAGLIDATATLQDAVEVAIGLIGSGPDSGDQATASIASALGMTGKPTTAEIVAAIHERKATTVPKDEMKHLQEQVASLTAERTERRATELVGSLVEAGKLNPNDTDNMEWARNLARTEPDRLASLMEKAPVLYKSDRMTPDAPANKTQRESVIASALTDYDNDSCGASKRWYVNAALDEKGLEHLNER